MRVLNLAGLSIEELKESIGEFSDDVEVYGQLRIYVDGPPKPDEETRVTVKDFAEMMQNSIDDRK